jgi:hypothetical protein
VHSWQVPEGDPVLMDPGPLFPESTQLLLWYLLCARCWQSSRGMTMGKTDLVLL